VRSPANRFAAITDRLNASATAVESRAREAVLACRVAAREMRGAIRAEKLLREF
jgi:hypothetical protein